MSEKKTFSTGSPVNSGLIPFFGNLKFYSSCFSVILDLPVVFSVTKLFVVATGGEKFI